MDSKSASLTPLSSTLAMCFELSKLFLLWSTMRGTKHPATSLLSLIDFLKKFLSSRQALSASESLLPSSTF